MTQKGEVHLNIEDHRLEDYVPPPKPKREAFTGAGHRLGRSAILFLCASLVQTISDGVLVDVL